MFRNILLVCVGNICRSPMAEGLFRARLQGREGLQVSSAGIGALVGEPADPFAVELLQARDIDLSAHRARQLSGALLRSADLVLVMEQGHKRAVEAMDPSARGKVFRLGEWRGVDISDPYQEPREAFERALALIEGGTDDWIARL